MLMKCVDDTKLGGIVNTEKERNILQGDFED